jgi:CDP-paratose 2-epimerase
VTDKIKVLVTGCAGFIGSHLVETCIRKGHIVYGIDNLSRRGTTHNLDVLRNLTKKSLRFSQFDLLDNKSLENFFHLNGPFDWIAHEAGQVAVTTSLASPLADFQCNAQATLLLLEAVRKKSPKSKLLFASTNKVYGELKNLEIIEEENRYSFANLLPGVTERQPLDFHSPYGCSKGAADQYICDYARSFGLKTVALRQSCIYGTRQFGLEDQGWVAWFLIATALGKPITIYGNGKQVRDLLWIEDLCSLYVKIWEKENFSWGKALNVGGGLQNTLSLLELFEFMGQLSIPLGKQTFAEWRKGDQKIFCSDNSRACELLDWSPSVSTREGVERLWSWIQQNLTEINLLLNTSAH